MGGLRGERWMEGVERPLITGSGDKSEGRYLSWGPTSSQAGLPLRQRGDFPKIGLGLTLVLYMSVEVWFSTFHPIRK